MQTFKVTCTYWDFAYLERVTSPTREVRASNVHTAVKKVLAPNASVGSVSIKKGQKIAITVERV